MVLYVLGNRPATLATFRNSTTSWEAPPPRISFPLNNVISQAPAPGLQRAHIFGSRMHLALLDARKPDADDAPPEAPGLALVIAKPSRRLNSR